MRSQTVYMLQLAPALLVALALAAPASAIQVDLVQSGGTAVGGVGGPGDTLVLDVVVTVGPGESLSSIFTTPQWDLGGGDVLDVVGSEIPAQLIGGVLFAPVGTNMRLGDPADSLAGSGVLFDRYDPVYPTRSGPAALFSIGVGGSGAFVAGPVNFTVGSVEFVLNSGAPTAVSFFLGPYYSTIATDAAFQDVTGQLVLGSFAVNVPEPSTGAFLALGLLGIAVGRRRAAARCQ